ncbi:putative PAS/PAC sensor protein [Rippkaea orientalis PCC 8801]|uniref:Putative PAS/PAC sensor protein n=1 Tax=Rippkaea orientalis (strain PCC 8801 / RF-1) TaxID=41431 RepID=B7JWI7_RIPO1|nr:PAS domain-containing protein [Rippkaea orientalis]ACK68328.1 putative PAS/PAC sensor protein [Rippkaea orientalis PCC 8801]
MKIKLQLDKLLDTLVSNYFVLNKTSFFEKLLFQGKPAINKNRNKTHNQSTTEDLIVKLRQENEKLKQVLEAKEKVIKHLTTSDNLGFNPNDFQLIIEGVADGVLLVNDEGKVKFINPSAEKLFARPKSELINYFLGLPIADDSTEVTIFRPGGHIVMAEMRVSVITWKSKTAYVASLRDVTVST